MTTPLYYSDYPSTAVQLTTGHSAEYDGTNAVLLVDDPDPQTIDVHLFLAPYDTTGGNNIWRTYKLTNSVKVPVLPDVPIPVMVKVATAEWREMIPHPANPIKLAPGEKIYVDQDGSDKIRIYAQKGVLKAS